MFDKIIVFSVVLSLLGSANRGAVWSEPPDIFVCKDAYISEENAADAVLLWEDLGYEFGMIISDFDCVYDEQKNYRHIFMPGSILIYPEFKGLNKKWGLGVTSIGFRDGKILYAVIETKDDDARVLAHEFGHTLNIRHKNRKDGLMNHYYNRGGWDTCGLSR